MRLHSQTAKIEGGFVLLPEQAHWLDAYLLELLTFPNAKTDDQVDFDRLRASMDDAKSTNLHLGRQIPGRSLAIYGRDLPLMRDLVD